MSYLTLKYLHISIVIISVGGFIVRGLWMLYAPARLERRWVRTVPHIVDTLLFATGITLALSQQISPGTQPWFAVKLTAIMIYILAGVVALRKGRSIWTRTTAFIIALGAAAWAAGSALSHQVLPWG